MANRSLRRAYNGGTESDGSIPDTIGSDKGSELEQPIGIENADTISDGNGDESESNTERDSGIIGSVEIDPEQLDEFIAERAGVSGNDSEGTRKRRKRGPNKRTTGTKKAEETVAPFLLMAHQWAAVFLKTPELMLDEKEAKQLSDTYSNFCQHHNVPVLSDKRMSEINMVVALALVYGPRFVAVRNRAREEKKVKAARNVTPIQGVM